MNLRRLRWAVAALLLAATPVHAAPLTLAAGTPIALETAQPLSSKVQVKGDRVELRTAQDIIVDGIVVIPTGTRAVGQIADARIKGAMGMSGRLSVSPLYIALGTHFVRLSGSAQNHASLSAGAVIGLATLGGAFTGRSAVIPVGTPVEAVTLNAVTLDPVAAAPAIAP